MGIIPTPLCATEILSKTTRVCTRRHTRNRTQLPSYNMLHTARPSKTRGSLLGSQLTHDNMPQPPHNHWRGLPRRLDKSIGQIMPSPLTPLHITRRPTTPYFHRGIPSNTSDMHRPLPNIRAPSHSSTKQGYIDHITRIPKPKRRQSHHTHTPTTPSPTIHNKHHMRTRPTTTHPNSIPNPTTFASPMVGENERSNTTIHF